MYAPLPAHSPSTADPQAWSGSSVALAPRGRVRTGASHQPYLKPRAFDYLVIGLTLTYVWRIQDIYPILGSVKVPVLISLAALGVWLVDGHASRSMSRLRHPLARTATFILLWMVLSVPTSVFPGLSFSFITGDHIKTYLMMLMIIGSIRGFADVERLIVAQVVGAGLYCFQILTSYQVGANGRLGDLAYYDSNDLAMLIVGTLPLAIYFLRGDAKPWRRFVALVCVAVFVVAIVRSGSRGGFLGLVAVAIFLLLAFRAIPARVRFGAVAGGALMLSLVAGPRYWEMMGTLLHPENDYNWSGNNEVGRMAIWQRGMGYMMQQPITGVGVNAFPVAEGTLSAISERQALGIGLKWSAAHNSFVQIGAELGIPGLIAFVLLLWQWLRTAWRDGQAPARASPRERARAALGQAMAGSLLGYVVCGFFLSQAYSAFVYTMVAILVGMAATAESVGVPAPKRGGRRHLARRL